MINKKIKALSKWINKYVVHILAIVFLVLILKILSFFQYERDYGIPFDKFRKKELHHTVEYIRREPYRDEFINFVYFRNIGEVRMYIDFDGLQKEDSVVKKKNQMRLQVFRNEIKIFDSRK